MMAVGKRFKKNQKIKKVTQGYVRRTKKAVNTNPKMQLEENKTSGSKKLDDTGMVWSIAKLIGKNSIFKYTKTATFAWVKRFSKYPRETAVS